MFRISAALLIVAGLSSSIAFGADENAAKKWPTERVVAHIRTVAEKLEAEYAKEAKEKKEREGDSDIWRELDYYAGVLRNRLFALAGEKTIGAEKARDLKWLAREAECRSYHTRQRETAAKYFGELKVMLMEIKAQIATREELPRGHAFQLKPIASEERMRAMQMKWEPKEDPDGDGRN